MRAIVLLALVAVASIGELASARHSNLHEWTQFKKQHGKVYANEAEDARRLSLFLAARERIEGHNANSSHAYKLGLNHLSDWTQEDLDKMVGVSHDLSEHQRLLDLAENDEFLQSLLNNSSPVPDQVDWSSNPDVVSPVLDQGHCASSFAFAAVGVLEGQQVATGFSKKLRPLSAGQTLHCTIHSKHCYGGLVLSALEDVHCIGGIETASDYVYRYGDLKCVFNPDKVFMKTHGGLDLPGGESVLRTMVGLFGPVAAHIQINAQFYAYKSGIFDDASCDGATLNQAVLVVGYGTDKEHGDYWILKNSWGTKWGENGYIRMKRGTRRCGLGKLSTISKF